MIGAAVALLALPALYSRVEAAMHAPPPLLRATVGETGAIQTQPAEGSSSTVAVAAVALGVGIVALMGTMFLLGRRRSGGGTLMLVAPRASSPIGRPSGVRAYLPRRASRRLVRRGAGGRFERI